MGLATGLTMSPATGRPVQQALVSIAPTATRIARFTGCVECRRIYDVARERIQF
jgi:hypothetical protein